MLFINLKLPKLSIKYFEYLNTKKNMSEKSTDKYKQDLKELKVKYKKLETKYTELLNK